MKLNGFTLAPYLATYHPGLVAEVVDGVQGVDTGDACILQTDNDVSVVTVLRHAEGMLSNQHEIWLETSRKHNREGHDCECVCMFICVGMCGYCQTPESGSRLTALLKTSVAQTECVNGVPPI